MADGIPPLHKLDDATTTFWRCARCLMFLADGHHGFLTRAPPSAGSVLGEPPLRCAHNDSRGDSLGARGDRGCVTSRRQRSVLTGLPGDPRLKNVSCSGTRRLLGT
jgi:hypothetical protein